MAQASAAGEIIPTICGACHNNCGMLVHVQDGVIREIKGNPDHPMNHGALCVKGKAMRELVYAPDRVRQPLKRAGERGEGRWQAISWDEALDTIAAAAPGDPRRVGARGADVRYRRAGDGIPAVCLW